jgi:hypothetical protein
VRWEYQTLIAPRQAGLCADGKHFWVLCSDGAEGGAWSLEEIDFKKNKSDWSFDTYLSALAPIGFIRPPAGWNLLAVPGDSAIAAFLKDNSRVWQSSPLGTNAAQYLPMSLRKDPSGDGFLTSFTAEGTGGATRLAYLSATDGEEVTHLEQWSDKGVLSPLPAFRCLAPGPASTKKAVHPVKKSVPVRKSPGVKGAKSAAPTPRP